MPQDKRTFLGGMNKDIDPRLLKNPDYIDALNIRVASSVDGTLGSVENIQGNEKVATPFYNASQEIIYEQDGNLYTEVNPATVFHQEVIRISGWEEASGNYNFKLYSLYQIDESNTGRVLIGDFSFQGNQGYTGTAQYLSSQFSETGTYSNGITIRDYNNGDQYTAKIKLITFNPGSTLNGGYFDIVIEADDPGVNFVLVANSNVNPENYYNHLLNNNYDSIPIISNGNVTLSIRDSFDTGGNFNFSTTEDGFIVSPDGTFFEVGNRCLYRFRMQGIEPTSPEDPSPSVTLFSYRNNSENDNNILTDIDIEVLPFLEIGPDLFNSGDDYEFTSNQNKISEWLHNEFSQPKTILCEDLPLSFNIPIENFTLTFSNGSILSEENDQFLDVMIVGPPGVKFKLGFSTSQVNLINDVGTGNVSGTTPAIFSTGLVANVVTENILSQSSLQLTEGIYDNFQALSNEISNLEYTINVTLANQIGQLNEEIAQAESDLADQTANFEEAQANYENYFTLYNQGQDTIQGLEMENDVLESQVTYEQNQFLELQGDFSTLQEDFGMMETAVSNLQGAVNNIVIGDPDSISFPEQIVPLIIDLSNVIETTVNDYEAYIVTLNDTNAAELLEANTNFEAAQSELSNLLGVVIPDLNNQILTLQNQLIQTDSGSILTQEEYDDILNDLSTAQANYNQEQYDHYQTNQELITANATIASLSQQLEELNISDIIARETFNQAQELAANINSSFHTTMNSYMQLNPGGGNIYQEDFSDINTFKNDFRAYSDILSYSTIQVAMFPEDLQNEGFIQPGYLRLYNGSDSEDIYTATSLGSSNFASGWAPGNTLAGTITFQTVNQVGQISIVLTNFLDPNGNWESNNPLVYFYDQILLEETGADQTFSFEFTIPSDTEFNQYNRRFVIGVFGGTGGNLALYNTEIRVTNLIIAKSGALIASQVSSVNASDAHDAYNTLAEEIEVIFADAEGQNESLSDYYNSTIISGYPVDEYVFNTVIPGYTLEASLWNLLSDYQREFLSFAIDVQNQLSVTLDIYAQSLGGSELITASTIADLLVQQQELQDEQNSNIAELEELTNQLENVQGSIATAWQAFGSPYSFTKCINIVGPEPGLVSGIPPGGSFNSFYASQGSYVFPGTLENGMYLLPRFGGPEGDFYGGQDSKLQIITGEQLSDLFNEPYSETNNFFYYLRQNIPFDGYRWTYNAPEESGYGTQEAYVYWVNFDETTNELTDVNGSGPFPSITEGINGAAAPFNFDPNTAEEQTANLPMIQLAIVYDNGNPDNLPCARANPATDAQGNELEFSNTLVESWLNNPFKLKDISFFCNNADNSAVYYMLTNQALASANGIDFIGGGGTFVALGSWANLPELRVRED